MHTAVGSETTSLAGPALLAEMLGHTLSLTRSEHTTPSALEDLEQVVLGWLHQLLRLPLPRSATLHRSTISATRLALSAAREVLPPESRTRLRLYASELAQPAVLTAARQLGWLETGSLRLLPVDAAGQIDPQLLRQALHEDRASEWHPLVVVATVGTSTLGSRDPVAELAEICAHEHVWLHVDATLYGAAALDPTQSALLDGAQGASSLLVNLAPWLPLAQSTCALWLARPSSLQVIWQVEEPAHLALPIWMMLRYFGQVGLVRRLREYTRLAHLFACWLDAHEEWERLTRSVVHSVCFRARPPMLTDQAALSTLNRHLCERVNAAGRFVVEPVLLHQRFALRVTFGNLRLVEEDVSLLCAQLEDALHHAYPSPTPDKMGDSS